MTSENRERFLHFMESDPELRQALQVAEAIVVPMREKMASYLFTYLVAKRILVEGQILMEQGAVVDELPSLLTHEDLCARAMRDFCIEEADVARSVIDFRARISGQAH